MRQAEIKRLVWAWMALIILAACGTKPTAEPTPTASTIVDATATIAPDASPTEPEYPAPITVATETTYPGPEEVVGTVYPIPEAGGATAYPVPANPALQTPPFTQTPQSFVTAQATRTVAPIATASPSATPVRARPTPTQTFAYPPPVDNGSSGAYPEPPTEAPPTTAVPNQSIPQTPTPVLQPGEVVTGSLPTATSTPILVRTDLIATNPSDFNLVSGGYQMVELFASWAPISRSMAPVMNMLAERYKARINFVFLDVDDPANGMLTALMGSRLPPVFYLLDGQGVVLKEWRGYISPGEFEAVFLTLP